MILDLSYLRENIPLSLQYFESIDSTSLYLKRCIKDGTDVPGLVIASSQTDGQGRVGRSFYSPEDTGLYLTFAFSSEKFSCEDLTPRVALAVSSAIDEVFSVQTGIKWVNDIYLNFRKVSGVLCQKVNDYYLIGIGINVEAPRFIPDELKQRFGSICVTCEKEQYTKLILALYRNLIFYSDLSKEKVRSFFLDKCIHINKTVSIEFDHGVLEGKCVGIGDDFSLLVEIDGETRAFDSGFMSLKI